MVMSRPDQRLHDEVRHHAAVIGVHARPVGVEDTRHLDGHAVLAAVVEEQRFRAALPLVVAGAQADRIDVAPVVLRLRMNARVAVDLGGGGLQDRHAQPLGEAQHVDGADDAGLGRLHRVVLVMDGRGRTGQIVDAVDLHVEREGHVVPHQLEARVVQEVRDVAPRAGEEIVDAEHFRTVGEQPVAKMRAEEPRPAGDQNSRVRNAVPSPSALPARRHAHRQCSFMKGARFHGP